MNLNDRPRDQGDNEAAAKAELTAFLAAAAAARAEQAAFGRYAPAAMERLAKACYGHDNSQAQFVGACLASIYNGADARPVRLDEIRWLDWTLQRDLLTVLIGTGHAGFTDTAIRESFEAIAGPAGAEWLHWYSSGGPHKAALRRLLARAAEQPPTANARWVRELLHALCDTNTKVTLASLAYDDREVTIDFALLVDGLFGRDKGALTPEDVAQAITEANLAPDNPCG